MNQSLISRFLSQQPFNWIFEQLPFLLRQVVDSAASHGMTRSQKHSSASRAKTQEICDESKEEEKNIGIPKTFR